MSLIMDVGWEGLVRRPCGRALAATHMAYLCAALDGGGAFGLVRPAEIVLPACDQCKKGYLPDADPVAESFDADLRKRGCSVGLRPAVDTLRAWMSLMRSRDPAEPVAGGGAGQGGEGRSARGASAPMQLRAGAGEHGFNEEEGQAHRGQVPPGAGSCNLPPYNRSATVATCLRLAKGLLARWGEPIPGARLDTDSGGNGGGVGPQLPKVGGCAVLCEALACSRLALLQAVQGRERVPRRTRGQLRAWWETYVAAAQHPEALTVGELEDDGLDVPQDAGSTGAPVRPSADTVAALEAGLLPCLARLVTRMGAGTTEGSVRSPGYDYPMFQLHWSELMLHGPLGQVGELVSATGRRVRLAVGELRAVVAAGGGVGRRRGRSVGWLAEVTDEVLTFARDRLKDLGYEVLGCRQHVGGGEQQHTGAAEEQGAAGAGPIRAKGGQQAQNAVRYSYAAAELLPQVSAGVQLCAELERWEEGGGGRGHGGVADAACEASAYLMSCSSSLIPTALECTNLILAKHIGAAAERHGVLAAADGGGAGCSSSGDGRSVLSAGGLDTPWRQLLLQEVRLMGLLGAAVQLWDGVEAEYAWAKHFAQGAHDARVDELVRKQLSAAMVMSAVAFPVEFRAAAGGKRTHGSAGPRAVTRAAAAAAAGKRAAGGAGGGSGPCIDLADARVVMGDAGCGDGAEVVTRVLGGWEPTAGEAWELASSCLGRCGLAAGEQLAGILAALVPPAEARAAVAAAAAVSG